MIVLGCDPGKKGAFAKYDGKSLSIVEMPTVAVGKRGDEISWQGLADLFDLVLMPCDCAFIEAVHAMPGQGVSSMFKFGGAYHGALAMLAAFRIPTTRVTPQSWKSAMRVNAAGKDAAVGRARELFPNNVSDFVGPRGGLKDGNAEAALIAWFGYQKMVTGR